jgi:hypothetical protein
MSSKILLGQGYFRGERYHWVRAMGLLLLLACTLTGCSDSPAGLEDESELPQLVAIGDTTSGALGAPGSIDRYQFEGRTGDYLQVQFQVSEAQTSATLVLEVLDPEGEVLEQVIGRGGPPSLEGQGARPFLLPATGTYTVQVRGNSSADRGAYTFVVLYSALQLVIGDTVISATYATGASQEFTFSSIRGQELNAILKVLQPADSNGVSVLISNPLEVEIASIHASPGDTTELASVRFMIPDEGVYSMRVTPFRTEAGVRSNHSTPYRIRLQPINREPERVPAVFMPGDTITGELIDYIGDIDEFTFEGITGEEFNFFFQALTGAPNERLTASILGIGPYGPIRVSSADADTSLVAQASGSFELPYRGTFTIRVEAEEHTEARHVVGGYRFWLYPIDRAPESVSATIYPGDLIEGESIDQNGDIDEFRLVLTEPTEILPLILEPYDSSEIFTPVQLELISEASGAGVNFGAPIPAGAYLLRVRPEFSHGTRAYSGPYTLAIYEIDRAPESAPQRLAIGETVTESIDHHGDIDEFHFEAARGQHLNVLVAGVAGQSIAVPQPVVFHLESGQMIANAGIGLEENEWNTERLTIPSTGTYLIRLGGSRARWPHEGSHPYRLTIEELDTSPERVAALLAPGDSVIDEEIDFPGDVDEFRLSGDPGQEVVIAFLRAEEVSGGLRVDVLNPQTGDSLATTWSFGFLESTGRFFLPESGEAVVQVHEPRFSCSKWNCNPSFGFIGPYRLVTYAIDRAPESIGSTVALGDTISGEAIDMIGDVDEFTFEGLAGQRLVAHFRAKNAGSFGALVLEFIDPTTGDVLAHVKSWSDFGGEFEKSDSFQLPATRQYLIRVHGQEAYRGDSTRGEGAYRFLVELAA